MSHRCLSRLAAAAAACLILFLSLPMTYHASAAGSIIRAAEGGEFTPTCGADWVHPCDLQYAMTVRALPGDEIWVKAGTYYPTTNPTDRLASFVLREGISVYGGFAGNETERDQRDWKANRTILSGDIDHNDLASPAETADQIQGANSLHVVVGSNVAVDAVLDGFIITAGQAMTDTSFGANGGGVKIFSSYTPPTDSGRIRISNVHLMGNRAIGGGCVYIDDSGVLTDVIITGCTADKIGGGVYVYGFPILTRVTISGSNSDLGGGMGITYGSPILTDITLTGNTAVRHGGGLYAYLANPPISQVVFANNAAGTDGGGAYFSHSRPVISGATFENNRANGSGGAIYNGYRVLTLRDGLMTGNSALNGGAMYSFENIADLTNLTVTGNTASGQGGGFYLNSSDPASVQVMKHLTITNNYAPRDGGLFVTGTKLPEIYNSILWGNRDATVYKKQITGTATVRNSVIEGNYAGENIRIDDPLLGTLSDMGGRVRVLPLLPGSPAADFADAAYCPDADARAVARPQGAGCDAGAYESRSFQVTVLGGDGQSTPLYRLFPQPLEMSITSAYGEPVNGGRLSVSFLSDKFKYDAKDLTISNGKATVRARAGSTEGSHTVWFSPSLTPTPGGPDSAAFNLTNTPAVFAVFRVALNGSDESSCGDRWDRPCSFEQARVLSVAGDEIWVKAGTYHNPTESPINLPKGVAIYGGFAGTETTREERDWEANVTILSGDTDRNDLASPITDPAQIQGRNSRSVVSGWFCGEVTLDGFTITGAGSDSGIRMRFCQASLRNLIIQGNMSDDEGGGFYDQDSTLLLNNVIFRYNHASEGGGGVFAKGSHSIRMENVTFAENTAGYDGGGAWLATLGDQIMKNVTFIGNVAGDSGGGLWLHGMEFELNGGMFSGNQAAMGGGLYFDNSLLELNVENVTFSGNSATVSGGAMMLDYCSLHLSCAFRHLTIAGNGAPSGGGIYLKSGFYQVFNSILWNNTPDQIFVYRGELDIAKSIVEGGFEGGETILTADPLLAPLGDYGGGTQTFALLPGSPAIDSGQSSSCSATDQRGVARPQGAGCDMGAFESRGFTLAVIGGAAQSTLITQPFANPLAVLVRSAANEPVEGGLVTFTPPAQGASAVITGSPARITSDRAAVTAWANETGGAYEVTAGGPGIQPATFHLTNLPASVPTLNAIEPAGVWEDSPAFTLTVTGENFAPEAVIRWNSIDLDTVWVDSTTLRAEIPPEWIEEPREVQITVANPEPGGGESGVAVFTVYERLRVFLPVMVGE